MTPKVSIIVPVYNAEQYINACIESLLAQNFTEWEMLLVDDGSTDGSLARCSEYVQRDSRIKCFSKANGGAASARNFGIEHMSSASEYIVFCDSDDTVHPDYIATMYSHIEGYDCVVCNMMKKHARWNVVNHLGNVNLSIDGKPFARPEFIDYFKTGLINSSCNKLYKASIIRDKDVRFSTDAYNEDLWFNLMYLDHCNSVRIIKDTLYYYHHHATSVTNSPPERAFTDYMEIQRWLVVRVPVAYHETIHDFVSHQYIGLSVKYMRTRHPEVPRKYLKMPLVQKALSSHKCGSLVERVQCVMLRLRLLKMYRFLFLDYIV